MQVKVSGRHMGLSDAVTKYCQEKAGKLTRFNDRISLIDVVVDGKAGHHTVELIAHVEGAAHPFLATEHHDDVFAAFDLVIEKVERQLRDDKERRRNRKHLVHPPEETGL